MLGYIVFRRPKYPDNPDKGTFIIENIDKVFLEEQVSTTLKAYEQVRYRHQGPAENFFGIVTEYTFDGWLEQLGLKRGEDYEWNERRPDYWENDARLSPDFKLKNGLTFEVKSARPYHEKARFDLKYPDKEADYFVQVQVNRLKCSIKIFHKGKERWYVVDAKNKSFQSEIVDPEKIEFLEAFEEPDLGEAKIVGFDEVKKILRGEHGWRKDSDMRFPAMTKPIDHLRPIKDLRKIIFESLGTGIG